MSKISIDAAILLIAHQEFKRSNTEVKVNDQYSELFLFGNRIATVYGGGNLYITSAGWMTMTTKDRLNHLPGVEIIQRKGLWYLNGWQWNGEEVHVNRWIGYH